MVFLRDAVRLVNHRFPGLFRALKYIIIHLVALIVSIYVCRLVYWRAFDHSYIPQFIRDTEHAWIREDPLRLQRNPNARDLLCNLDSPLSPPIAKGLEPEGMQEYRPTDLFRKLRVQNSNNNRLGWANAVARFSEILDSPAALQDVEELRVDMYIHHGKWTDGRDGPRAPDMLPDLIVKTLSAMKSLRRLDWSLNDKFAGPIREEVDRQDGPPLLPMVRELRLDPYSEFWVRHCPSVEVVESGPGYYPSWRYGNWMDHPKGDPKLALLEALRGVPSVRKFVTGEGTWEWGATTVAKLIESLPQLEELDMYSLDPHDWENFPGGMNITASGQESAISAVWSDKGHAYHDLGPLLSEEGPTFPRLLDLLSRAPNLKHVDFPHSYDLGLGFDGGAGGGNAYDGPDGRAYGRLVAEQSALTTEKAGKMVVERLSNLESFSIGYHRPKKAGLDEAGAKVLTWAWTGRMEEWKLEKYSL